MTTVLLKASSEGSLHRIRELITQLLVGDEADVVAADDELIMSVVYQLDAAQRNESSLRLAASAFGRLLAQVSSNDQAVALVPLIGSRTRLAELLERHIEGLVDRRGFDSYLGKQGWLEKVSTAISRLSVAELKELHDALEAEDYDRTAMMLFSKRHP